MRVWNLAIRRRLLSSRMGARERGEEEKEEKEGEEAEENEEEGGWRSETRQEEE